MTHTHIFQCYVKKQIDLHKFCLLAPNSKWIKCRMERERIRGCWLKIEFNSYSNEPLFLTYSYVHSREVIWFIWLSALLISICIFLQVSQRWLACSYANTFRFAPFSLIFICADRFEYKANFLWAIECW